MKRHQRRVNTVHDFTALRLHPDGSRVPSQPHASASSAPQSATGEITASTALHTRRTTYTAQDARGNWYAKDAAGMWKVKKRRYVSDDDGEDEGAGLAERDERAQAANSTEQKKPRGVGKIATKRRRFADNLDFLSAGSVPGPTSVGAQLPAPTSDLLKCIHHFASLYYTSQSQLSDVTREFRYARQAKNQNKLVEGKGGQKERDRDVDADDDEQSSGIGDGSEEEIQEGGGDVEESARSKRRRKRRTRKELKRDMYKIFDGSALMAIGMLLQEHVAQMLKPNLPPGWDHATKTFQPESDDEEEVEGQEEEEVEGREEEEQEQDKKRVEEVSTDSSRGDTTDDSGSDE